MTLTVQEAQHLLLDVLTLHLQDEPDTNHLITQLQGRLGGSEQAHETLVMAFGALLLLQKCLIELDRGGPGRMQVLTELRSVIGPP